MIIPTTFPLRSTHCATIASLFCCARPLLRAFGRLSFAHLLDVVHRAQQDQKPVIRRPVCHVPPLREDCAAPQLCTKCGAIGTGRLDWHEEDGAGTEAVAVVEAVVAKAAADFPGFEKDSTMATSTEGKDAQFDSKEDSVMHSIFDRILRGGGVGNLQPGTGSQRFFCMKCWQ